MRVVAASENSTKLRAVYSTLCGLMKDEYKNGEK